MKKELYLFASVSLLSMMVASASAAPVGQPAPDFSVIDSNGVTHTLSDHKGKLIVLEWVNHGCPFVAKFYNVGEMQRLQKEYTEKDVVWLTVNTSAPGKQGHMNAELANQVLEEKNASPTAVLLDHDGVMGRAYGATVTPHMYVIDTEGILVYNGAIDSIRSARSADIERAENYVVAALEATMNGEAVATPVSQPYGCSMKY